jgi:hypothetical protein
MRRNDSRRASLTTVTTGFGVVPHSPDPGRGKTITAFERKVRKVIDKTDELKRFDFSLDYFNVGAGGSVVSLTDVPQGITQTTRVGTDIAIKQFEFRLSAYQNNTTALQLPNLVRVILFIWHDNNSTFSPLPTSVLQTASILSIGPSICSPYQWETERQGTLEVIHDEILKTSLNAFSDALVFKKTMDHPVSFTQGTNSGAHKLFCCVLSDDAGVVSPVPAVSFFSRITYAD